MICRNKGAFIELLYWDFIIIKYPHFIDLINLLIPWIPDPGCYK
jgi:hypothetical protein